MHVHYPYSIPLLNPFFLCPRSISYTSVLHVPRFLIISRMQPLKNIIWFIAVALSDRGCRSNNVSLSNCTFRWEVKRKCVSRIWFSSIRRPNTVKGEPSCGSRECLGYRIFETLFSPSLSLSLFLICVFHLNSDKRCSCNIPWLPLFPST